MPKGIISDAYRRELISLLEDFMTTKGLDPESASRARSLSEHLRAPDRIGQ